APIKNHDSLDGDVVRVCGVERGHGVALGVTGGVGVGLGVGVGPPCTQYLPPLTKNPGSPPQTIISLPVQAAVCPVRGEGALLVLVGAQVSASGLYFPPVT